MITLLASLTGFISSLLPYALRFFRDREDKKHELAILDKQITLQKAGIKEKMEDINALTTMHETLALYKTYHTGIRWIDALNGTVRPVLAYAFFFVYALVKYLQWEMLTLSAAPLIIKTELLWNVEDQAIFAGIVSFYYGQRALSKMTGRQCFRRHADCHPREGGDPVRFSKAETKHKIIDYTLADARVGLDSRLRGNDIVF